MKLFPYLRPIIIFITILILAVCLSKAVRNSADSPKVRYILYTFFKTPVLICRNSRLLYLFHPLLSTVSACSLPCKNIWMSLANIYWKKKVDQNSGEIVSQPVPGASDGTSKADQSCPPLTWHYHAPAVLSLLPPPLCLVERGHCPVLWPQASLPKRGRALGVRSPWMTYFVGHL